MANTSVVALTKPVAETPLAVASYMAVDAKEPDPTSPNYLRLSHIILGLEVDGARMFNARYTPDGTEQLTEITLGEGQPERLTDYFKQTYADPNLAKYAPEEMPPDQYNCYGFAANIGGHSNSTYGSPYKRYSHGMNVVEADSPLEAGRVYAAEDSELDLILHGFVGAHVNGAKDWTLSVMGNNGPLIAMPRSDILPYTETDTINTVSLKQ